MLLFQRERKAVDDGAEYFEKFSNSIEPLRFVDELEKDVIDGPSDVRSEVEKLSVYSMKRGFEEIPFSRVFRVEKFKQLDRC